MKNVYFYSTRIGRIGIADNGEAITNLSFCGNEIPQGMNVRETSLILEAADQLRDYLDGRLKRFTIPIAPEGTEFQRNVWEALAAIPYGETRSYSEIAAVVGRPKACRAVGMANNKNPLAILIPCHRVIGSNGKLTGYAGGLDIKEQLLELERINSNS